MSEMTRDRAIEILRDDASGASFWELAEAVEMGIKALEEQRPHGEWIEHRQYYMNYFVSEYECSNCRDEVWQETEWQFCPNCGADMRPKEGEAE